MPQAPDLKDPAQLDAYKRELRGVAAGLRRTGVGLAVLGAAIALARAYVWRDIPVLAPVSLIGLGFLVMISAIATRTRYHQLRMRG